ncbi:hypothetical protein, partial [Anaerotruncus colihominis]|uniref:hypothetical protein n=1 Tax=Anaerotruncus colihominis TaxID=169435 RepID=UPI002672494E
IHGRIITDRPLVGGVPAPLCQVVEGVTHGGFLYEVSILEGVVQILQGCADQIGIFRNPGQRVIGIFTRHRHHQREKAITNQDHSAFVMAGNKPTAIRATGLSRHRADFFHQIFTILSNV